MLSVPHHGGHIDIDDSNIEWLYNEAIKADVAVISVATTSRSHPRPEVVRSLKVSGAHVMCSQISSRCTSDLESARSNGIPLLHSSASTPTKTVKTTQSRSGRVRNRSVRVPCAGTVRVELQQDSLTVDSIAEHQAFVNNLADEPVCPMCRMASS